VTRRYVLTGAPGAGKTVLLHALAARGWPVVQEAATDVIAALQADGVDQPWTRDDFCDRIIALQRQRQQAPSAPTPPSRSMTAHRCAPSPWPATSTGP